MTSQFKAIVEIEGLSLSKARIKDMGQRAFSTEVLMEEMAEKLEIAARARLVTAPWKPLTGATVTRKASQGENTAILRDEWRPIGGTPTRKGDALYSALDGGPGSYKLATRTTATYGIRTTGDLFYARFVQNTKGTKRKLLAIPEGHAVGMVDAIIVYILDIGNLGQRSDYVGRRL